MPRLRIAVTGLQGQFVQSLVEKGAERGIEVAAVGRPALDLGDPRTIHPAIEAANAHVIVNAAACSNTEDAEASPEIAHAINASGAGALAQSARKLGIPIVQLSTAHVFNGLKPLPYRETDPVNPLNAYGRSKLDGERAVAAAQPDHVIIRCSLIYSPFGRNFLTAMLTHAAHADEVRVVADQYGSPVAASDVADGVVTVAENLAADRPDRQYRGVFHIGSDEIATWADLASAIFAISAEQGGPTARVVRVATADYGSRVRRPANASLDGAKIATVHGVRSRRWRDSLRESIVRFLQKQK